MRQLLRRDRPFESASRQPRFRSALVRAGLVRAALGLTVLVAGARTVALFTAALLIDRPLPEAPGLLDDVLEVVDVLTLATLIVAVVTWLLWVTWTSRLEENASALGAGDGSVGPRGAILWWLVPGPNLLVPFGQLLGLDRRLSNVERPSHDLLLASWWIAFLAVGAVVVATTGALAQGGPADGTLTSRALLQAGLASLAWLVVALIARRVVREVQRDEDRRSAVVRDRSRPGAPSWAVAPQPTYPSMPRRRAVERNPLAALAPIVVIAAVAGVVWLAAMVVGAATEGGDGPGASAPPSLAVAATPRQSLTLVTQPPGSGTPSGSPGAGSPGAGSPVAGSPVPTASVDPVAAGNELLLAHTTDGDGQCTAAGASSRPPDATAAIECRPANVAVGTVRYALFPTPEAAEAAYQAHLEDSGIEPDTGDCFEGIPGETGFRTNESARGRVVCWLDNASDRPAPFIVWFDRTLAIVGEATGTGAELKPLCDWWADESGPA